MIKYDYNYSRWGLLWRSGNNLDGKIEYLIYREGEPMLFKTRKQAREYKKSRFGYISGRKDLQNEPFGWKPPKVVKVDISLNMRRANGD